MVKLTIDPEFQHLLIPLTAEEYAQLERNILDNGCLDPLKPGRGKLANTILDGHNRYEICTKHGVKFEIERLDIEDRKEAHDWIINNQLGRRNVTPDQASYLRGKRYINEKKEAHRPEKGGQNARLSNAGKTANNLAGEYNVDEKTIRRDAKFAEAVDTIASNGDSKARNAILSGQAKLSKQDVLQIAAMPAPQRAAVAEKIKTGEAKSAIQAVRDVYRQGAADTAIDSRPFINCVRDLKEHKAWKRYFKDGAKTWERFCEEVLDTKAEFVDQVQRGVEVLEDAGHFGPIPEIQALDAAKLGKPGRPVTSYTSKFKGDMENKGANGTLSTRKVNNRGSNSTEYQKARLKRDHEDIYEQLITGKYPSVRAAAKAAGIVRELTTVEKMQKLWLKMTPEEKEAFQIWATEQL